MKIIIATNDYSSYLAEILRAFGHCGAQEMPIAEALQKADPKNDLLILPRGTQSDNLEEFLRNGGRAIALRPFDEIAKLAGLQKAEERAEHSRLRLTAPLCDAARGEPLWTPVSREVWKNGAGEILAHLYEPGAQRDPDAGIMRCAVGDGTLTIFAYDPVECIIWLRQGNPELANTTPLPEQTPRAIYLQEPDAPHDAEWRPTADLHAMVLCNVVKKSLQERAPVVSVWHLPSAKPAILLFSGDEDGGTQEANDVQMSALEEYGGAMNLYVIQDATSITPEKITEYTRRGHTISVHPDLTVKNSESQQKQLEKAQSDVLAFQEKFGQPVKTLRNHCYMWPGYVELPALYGSLRIGMDFNTTSTCYGRSADFGPYLNLNAAMPLPYVQTNGNLIDVYGQPTHFNDDLLCHPDQETSMQYSLAEFDVVARRILEDAAHYFHAPICANFHPINFVEFSGEQGRMLIRRAAQMELPIWSTEHWHNFWRARASWRMEQYSWNAPQLSFVLKGEPCSELTINLPFTFEGKPLSDLRCNDEAMPIEKIERFGEEVAPAILPDGAKEVKVVAKYQ